MSIRQAHTSFDEYSLRERYFHKMFVIGVVVKGINGAFEILGGILLLVIRTEAINKTLVYLTQGELIEDPNDFLANAILHLSHNLSISTKMFGAIYLLSHGVIKIGLVIALLKKKLWAYPASILFLIVFIIYQIYRLAVGYSVGMVLLTILDLIIVILIWREYGIVRRSFDKSQTAI